MQADAATLSATHCPICGKANQCAMEAQRESGDAQPPCWCTRADFRKALLARLPKESRGVACICAACADEAAQADGRASSLALRKPPVP